MVLLKVCWGLTIAVWVLGSLYNRVKSPPVVRRELPVSWILGGLLYGLVRYVIPGSWMQTMVYWTPWMEWSGVALLTLSTAFTIWSRIVLGRMWSSEPSARSEHELRVTGPYAVTRNPIYTGLIGMTAGSAAICGWGPMLVVLLGIMGIFQYKIHLEERLLRATFGLAFDAYERRVPRLLPWPHPRDR